MVKSENGFNHFLFFEKSKSLIEVNDMEAFIFIGVQSTGIIAEAEKFCYPCFIKPLVPKIFSARKYSSYEDLLEECKQLDDGTPVVYSDIVKISSEVRFFLLDGQVYTASAYEGEADISDAEAFINRFISENRDLIPPTCVIDIGYIVEGGWAIIEANAVWGAGLNGCDPLAAAMCIAEATKVYEEA